MSCIFVAPYLNKYLSTAWWYILIDREFCTLYNDAVYFFSNFYLFLLLFNLLLLYDVVKQFSANFSLRIQIEPKHCRNSLKINQVLGNDSVNERCALFDVGLRILFWRF